MYFELKFSFLGKLLLQFRKILSQKSYHHMKQLGWQINALELLNIKLIF